MSADLIRHYYHVYADGRWEPPVREHLAAMAKGNLTPEDVTMVAGIVGHPANRESAMAVLESWGPVQFLEAETGWEQLTLERLHRDSHTFTGPMLYAHTKGASDWSPINIRWRRSMSRLVVADADRCLDALYKGKHDAVGCHWLTQDEFPGLIEIPIFGGNFWWADSKFIRTLPPLEYNTRHDAEGWIGKGRPAAFDRLPGWPGIALFNYGVTHAR